MKNLACLPGLLAVFAIAIQTVYAKSSHFPIEDIQKMKDPLTYEPLKAHIAELATTELLISSVKWSNAKEKEEAEKMKKMTSFLKKAYEFAYDFGHKFLIEGANPTEQEVAAFARKTSETLRENHVSIQKLDEYDLDKKGKIIITNEAVKTIAKIVAENRLMEDENVFMAKLAESSPTLSKYARSLKQTSVILANITQILFEEESRKSMAEVIDGSDVGEILFEAVGNELLVLLQSEDNAVALFEDIRVLLGTLKNPASYDSLQTFYDALTRSKTLEALTIFIKQEFDCVIIDLPNKSKKAFNDFAEKVLGYLKKLLADGQNTTNEDLAAAEQHLEEEVEKIEMPLGLIYFQFQSERSKQFVKNCLISDEDRKTYQNLLTADDQVFNEEKLSEIKEADEKVHALVQIINGLVKAKRRRVDLDGQVDAHFKEFVTTPKLLLSLAHYFNPSDETKALIKAETKRFIEKHNALSADVKRNLVKELPYFTFIKLSVLN